MTDPNYQPDHSSGDVTADSAEASGRSGEYAPEVLYLDTLARAIAERATDLIATTRQLTRAAGPGVGTEQKARVLLAIADADEKLAVLLCRLEPWRGGDSSDTAEERI